MREVETILERFPGPVTLYQSRLKIFIVFAFVLTLTVFAVWVLIPNPNNSWYEAVMSVLSALVAGYIAVRAALMLLLGKPASLTLDADGFERRFLFRRDRFHWQDVSSFRPQAEDEINWREPIGSITFEVRSANAIPRHRANALPDNYRLPKDDLVWLLEQWRQQALAQPTQQS
jgi:hypothetical protein